MSLCRIAATFAESLRRICRIAATGRAAWDTGSCLKVIEHGPSFFDVVRCRNQQLFGAFEQGGQGRGRELACIWRGGFFHIARSEWKFHIPNDFLRGRRFVPEECGGRQASLFEHHASEFEPVARLPGNGLRPTVIFCFQALCEGENIALAGRQREPGVFINEPCHSKEGNRQGHSSRGDGLEPQDQFFGCTLGRDAIRRGMKSLGERAEKGPRRLEWRRLRHATLPERDRDPGIEAVRIVAHGHDEGEQLLLGLLGSGEAIEHDAAGR